MEAHLHDWLSLLVRWAHFITGVAWIGASFYFNWLENHLQRHAQDDDIDGALWAIHGGGFYYLQKFRVAPATLPPELHWFKWEAYATWLTGFALLGITYYWNASAYLLSGAPQPLSAPTTIGIGIASLLLSWFLYDGLCRSPLARREWLTGVLVFAWFMLLAWLMSRVMNGRAAYIHVGAAIGTVMVANVFRVIIPAQKELVTALTENRKPNPAPGRQALHRSRHNNYFTLPVLFIMISSHYPATWSHPQGWLILALVSLGMVGIRHFFNIRHLPGRSLWVLPVSAVMLGLAVWLTWPKPRAVDTAITVVPDIAQIMPVIKQRCAGCHSAEPTQTGFAVAPLGIVLDTEAQVEALAGRIGITVTQTRSMPLGNLTGITEEERDLIGRWFEGPD